MKPTDTIKDPINNISLVDLFLIQVMKNPDNIAVVFETKKITYKDLDQLSNQLAHFLITSHN